MPKYLNKNRFEKALKNKGYSKKEIANKISVTAPTISKWLNENNPQVICKTHLKSLSYILETSEEYLTGDNKNLISDMTREKAIKILKDTLYDERTPNNYIQAVRMGREALENQKIGHWIVYSELNGEWEGTKKYACDKCGEKVGVFKSNFCPNCGAKMEGENK